MQEAREVMATWGHNAEGREYPRRPVTIPVHVKIAQAWQGTIGPGITGGLLNVSRGGAGVRLRHVLPPRTRLVISVPAATGTRHVLAEVVWTSEAPGSGIAQGMYGVQWLERLSSDSLKSLCLRTGSNLQEEVEDEPST
ncbi:MAG TPA: PilZ domain-containing protein [Candidatus Methylomirabilis sp.]|nr:PilZ domain-containing protein [Candidatus Methylomirabilis sp.]